MRYLFLWISVTGMFINTSAQKQIQFGLLGGLNYSKMNFERVSLPATNPYKTSFGFSARAGMFMEVSLQRKLSLRNEYIYTEVRGKVDDDNIRFDLNYLSLPVLFSFKATNALSLLAGPEVAVLIKARKKQDNTTEIITHDVEERSIGFTFGMAYQFVKKLGFHVRYQHGFNHIGIGQRSDVREFKLDQLQALLQITLN